MASDDFIFIKDEALSPDFCDELITRFEADENVGRGLTGHGVDVAKKDSWDIQISTRPEWKDPALKVLRAMSRELANYMRRYPALITGALSPTVVHPESGEEVVLDLDAFESFGERYVVQLMDNMYRCGRINMQKYLQGEGGYHHWHSEIYPQADGVEALRRVLLWQFYLNDVDEGGETSFLYQDRKISARKGRLVIAPAGFTHTHRGEVPISGDKYILTSWILFKTLQEMN